MTGDTAATNVTGSQHLKLKEMRDRDEQGTIFSSRRRGAVPARLMGAEPFEPKDTQWKPTEKMVCVLIVGNDRLGEYCSEKIKILE